MPWSADAGAGEESIFKLASRPQGGDAEASRRAVAREKREPDLPLADSEPERAHPTFGHTQSHHRVMPRSAAILEMLHGFMLNY